jgi:ribosomal protein S18 acetylase RimI-like enzyme
MLLMVQEENAPARALYQRVGYREEVVSPHYYGMGRGGIRMRKMRTLAT